MHVLALAVELHLPECRSLKAKRSVLKPITEGARRRYNVATIYKRAIGEGRIQRIEGLEAFKARHGAEIVWENLLPVGAPRRNWKQTLVSDGFVILRHPDLAITLAMADEFGEDVRLYAA